MGAVGVWRVRMHSRKFCTCRSVAQPKPFSDFFSMVGLFFGAFQKDLQLFAADVHAGLVAIQLIELIVAALVLHGGVVDGEDGDEILGILGDRHHGFRLIDALLVRLAGGGVDGAGDSPRPSACGCRRRRARPGRRGCRRRNRSRSASWRKRLGSNGRCAAGPCHCSQSSGPASLVAGAPPDSCSATRSGPCARCRGCRRPRWRGPPYIGRNCGAACPPG